MTAATWQFTSAGSWTPPPGYCGPIMTELTGTLDLRIATPGVSLNIGAGSLVTAWDGTAAYLVLTASTTINWTSPPGYAGPVLFSVTKDSTAQFDAYMPVAQGKILVANVADKITHSFTHTTGSQHGQALLVWFP